MDVELFMECEEEELEPWQQVDDEVEEDEIGFDDSYGQPIEDSSSPLPGYETPPPSSPPTASSPAQPVSSSSSFSSGLIPPPAPSTTSVTHLSAPLTPPISAPTVINQAHPLILTQTAGGTFLLPAASGAGSSQPILLTQGFPGTSLLLNLQPGQSVQPLTLIQSPSLGHLVQPNVGVSSILNQGQNRVGCNPPGGSVHPASSFTAMQLPTTLTIRSSTPGTTNLQMTQVGGTNFLKLAGSPALSSSSANGVTRVAVIGSSGNQPVISTAPTMSASAFNPTKVVMSVEEFYYGTHVGDLSLTKPLPLGLKPPTFTCQICTHLVENNLRLMQHLLQHSQLVGSDDRTFCRFCYRLFSSPSQLQTHKNLVHGSVLANSMCRICEWAFENEPTFLNHMKSNHKPGEMPYVCQVCSYRSSFYSDVLQHFSSFHRDSRFLLCIFCLKVTRNSVNFQDHLLRHQVSQAFHCSKCRLQFITLKEKMQHKQENHRSFRRPPQLDGLPPGSKVTIRTYGKVKRQTPGTERVSSTVVQPINMRMEPTKPLQQKNIVISKSPRAGVQKPGTSHVHRSSSCEEGKLICLECGTDVSKFTSHYPTYVKCLLCPYRTCCSNAYAAHMIHHHVPHSADRQVPLHKRPPPCPFLLHCSDCDYKSKTADLMAEHLLTNPAHYSATCQTHMFFEPDIQIFYSQWQPSSEKPRTDQNLDLPNPSWHSADCWKSPSEGDDAKCTIASFKETAGPRHLGKNSDAIDFFHLVFPQSLMELITKETNNHAKTCSFLDSSFADWVPVTTYEIKGFIGLVVLMGIQNLPDLSQYWSTNQYDNSYTFYRAMSYKRFKQIAANIRMGSLITEEYRCPNHSSDPLHIFRPMLDILGKAMWNAYQPNCCLTVDRALLPSLEDDKSSATPNSKAQPQVWLMCDSKSGYCHRFFIQVGEKENQEPGFTVVPQLVKDLQDKHHQLYLANSLASVPLMQKLLDQGIYASTSFPPPNPILPRELWNEGKLDRAGDFLQRQFGPLLATRWRDTKEMGCLSTNAGPGGADTVWRRSQTKVGALDPIDRPMAFRLLQENMRGVDICKQLLACNPLGGIPQDRHWRSLFWFLVNLSIVNAFIILRESRKDNPPSWVQDGLFMQVNFRKRLGNQLAKCAQKSFDKIEVANARPAKEVAPKPGRQRHRMTKISSISKRCRNCSLKNVRRESVYGCTLCKANLCNQPSCFWEFHGLSPLNRGSTKIGFLKDGTSGGVDVEEVEDNMDDAMAPLEDIDFSDNEDLDDMDDIYEESKDIKEEYFKETKPAVSDLNLTANGDIQSPTIVTKEHDDGLTARQLRISLMALNEGLGQASRVFSTHTQHIQMWLIEAKKRLKQCGLEQSNDSDGDGRLIAWVLSMREQQFLITESSLFHKASMLKKKGSFSESFRISYDWAVNFMLKHELGIKSIGIEPTLTRTLPGFLDAKVKSFRNFTGKMVKNHKFSENSVAAMDELSLFVDMRLIQDEDRRLEALELTGTIPLVTVYLTTLADGTMLPSLLLATGNLANKNLPEFILLETVSEGLSAEEALDLWINKVWITHLSNGPQPRKSMLIVDQHREHMGDHFLSCISGLGTLPALIPGGGSFSLHPLEMCMKPVLQRYLLHQWAKFTAEKPTELEEDSPQQLQVHVIQKLVDWLVEALTHLNKLQELWKTSFRLTGLFQKKDEQKEDTGQKPDEIQLDLLKTLTETLLGADFLKENPPHLPECNDKEDTEKEPGGQVLESPEEKQRKPKEKRQGPREDEVKEGKKETKQEQTTGDGGKGEDAKSDDSELEVKETKEDKEANKERRECRIVIGEDVGDEWTVKSRTEGTEAGRDDNVVIDKS